MKEKFDFKKISMKLKTHINAGSIANKSIYNVFHGDDRFAEVVRGSENKKPVNYIVHPDGEKTDLRNLSQEEIQEITRKIWESS